ncbi:flagellar biosynthetic protein FliO [Peribacillus glennii]|uniref:Flagellar biosynthesis protein FliZ n=1 Tax=Peribacillus glennii TaxID=2303991 RepID=A0A372LA27_9BACI|nr:flagellar biosynthetic protein FliO [Peribacillus glennii]RFU61538.1 flagellar biosynthesis protein FliZ [Peribacillus glennii]
MFSIKKVLQILLVIALGQAVFSGLAAKAESLDGSVKDFYEQPENPEEKKTQAGSNEKTDSSTGTDLSFWDFLRMVFALIFVVVLLYATLRFINKKSRAYQKANHIENIGGTSLGSNRSVQLIKVGNSILVLGVGESIELLKEIDDEDEYKSLLEEHNDKMELMIQPGNLLSTMKKRFQDSTPVSQGFSSQLKSELEELSKNRKKVMEELEGEERQR